MASFPTSTPAKPSGITAGNNVVVGHVDTAWDEIIALAGVLRGSSTLGAAGTNLSLKSGAVGATPLVIQGASGQTADLLRIGSDSDDDAWLKLTASGALHLPGTTNATGLMLGTSTTPNVFSTGTNVLVRPGANATGAVKVRNAADGASAVTVDTTNLRVGLGDDTAPSATLHLSAGSAVTTAAFGIRFGNDASEIFRSAALTLKVTNHLDVAGNLLLNGDFAISRTGANIATIATGDTLRAGSGAFFELSGEAGSNSFLKVTKSSTGNLTDPWVQTTLIGAETSSRFKIDAAGLATWTDGTNPGTPVTLGINGANLGLTTNKNFAVGGTLAVTGVATFGTLSFGATKMKQGNTDNSYSGTDVLTAYTKDLLIHTTASNQPSRLGFKRPDGIVRWVRLDNDDQFIVEAA